MTTKSNYFTFDDQKIRTLSVDGTPWFPAIDICNVLEITNPSYVVRMRLKEGESRMFSRSDVDVDDLKAVPNRGVLCVTESGLYKMAFQSQKYEARQFQDWVTSSVLPALRQDGAYVVGEEKVATGEMSEDEFILMAMEKLRAKTARLQGQVDTHLKYMAIDEFFALKHIYPGKGDNIAMGHRATRICREQGEVKRFQRRYAPAMKQVVEIGEYPVAVLEQAYSTMLADGRIPKNIPQMDLGLSGGVQ